MTDQSPLSTADAPEFAALMTPKEFARLLKVSVSWLAKARQRGEGPPFIQLGRSIRYFPFHNPG